MADERAQLVSLYRRYVMEREKKLSLLAQALRFLAVSGSGWLIDFGIFIFLTEQKHMIVAYANMLSSIPAMTLVFLVSTHKIFLNRNDGLPLWKKYAIYFLYRMVLVVCVSWLGEGLYQLLLPTSIAQISLISRHLKLLCKIFITPIIMGINFVVTKLLCERL